MSVSDRPRALVIGGSVGGLFAALCLRRAGWRADIFERSAGELADRGAGIGTGAQLYDLMQELGVAFDASDGVPSSLRQCFNTAGDITHRVEAESRASAWDRVYRPLRAAMPDEGYFQGRRLVAIHQDAHSATAEFADGSRETGDLIIGADGGQSTVRGLLAPQVGPRYAGYCAWRGLIEESELDPRDHAQMLAAQNFCFPFGELMLGLPVASREVGAPDGHRRFYWIWYRAANGEALRDVFTDASGHHHGMAIPPHLVRADVLDELRAHAPKSLAPQLARVVLKTARPFPSAIFDLEQDKLVFGRVALLGDSAFIARPHVASGLTKAAMDARALGQVAAGAGDLSAALAAYERSRIENGRAVVARARGMGAHLEAVARGDAHPPPHPEPVGYMREYGSGGRMV